MQQKDYCPTTFFFIKRVNLSFLICSVLFLLLSCNKDDSVIEQEDASKHIDQHVNDSLLSITKTAIFSLEAYNSQLKNITQSIDSIISLLPKNSLVANTLSTIKDSTINQQRKFEEYSNSINDSLVNKWDYTYEWSDIVLFSLDFYNKELSIIDETRKLIIDNAGLLETKLTVLDNSIQTIVTDLINWINVAYKYYYTSSSNDNQSIKNKIDSLNERLVILKNKLIKGSELDILFTEKEISCSSSDIIDIEYTVINGSSNAILFCKTEKNWSTTVIKETDSTGIIRVNTPEIITNSSILVYLNDGRDNTVVRALNFIEGSLSVSSNIFNAAADGDTINVGIETDLNYSVEVQGGVDWIHYDHIQTRSIMREEDVILFVDKNLNSQDRNSVVRLVNSAGLCIKEFTIRQQCNVIQPNEIWYTSFDKQVINPKRENGDLVAFGANIISNTYDEKGVILFDDNVKRIGNQAFMGQNNLKSISIPDSVTEIKESAFSWCSQLEAVVFPKALKTIEGGAFYKCGIKDIDLPSNLTFIGNSAFHYCNNLTEVQLPPSLKTLETGAFAECINLASINIPPLVFNISDLLYGCKSIKTFDIPSTVYTIGGNNGTFRNCSSLTSVKINNQYSDFKLAFANCTSLSEVYSTVHPFVIPASAFDNLDLSKMVLYVPKDTKIEYETVDVWKDFGTIIEVDSIVLPLPEAVDLGLSVNWASFNVGSCMPEQFGCRYAWGECYIKDDCVSDNYRWYKDGQYQSITKYCTLSNYGYNGFTDYITTLEKSDDVASLKLGGKWRYPTESELRELLYDCNWTWTLRNNVYGYLITGKNNNSIFLPCYTGEYTSNSQNTYWSSTINSSHPSWAYGLGMAPSGKELHNTFGRQYSRLIRAVCPK